MFRESVRDRVLYSIVAFAALVTGASLLISQLTAGQDVKIIKDLGLAAMSLFGAFIAIFIGIGLVAKEVEKKSIYSLLAKPVRRSRARDRQVLRPRADARDQSRRHDARVVRRAGVLSRFTAEELVRKSWEAPALDPHMLQAVYLIFVQLMLVTAIAVFFSTFSTSSMLSALFTIGSLRCRSVQRRPQEFRVRRLVASRRIHYTGALLRAAQYGGLRRQSRRRARTPGRRPGEWPRPRATGCCMSRRSSWRAS